MTKEKLLNKNSKVTNASKKAVIEAKRHPMLERASRDTGYLVWTNIGC